YTSLYFFMISSSPISTLFPYTTLFLSVYSQFGHNFYKTMLRLASERDTLNVVNDQIGTPTNANCLAQAIVQIIQQVKGDSQPKYGIYHFSNEGTCSWFDFAHKIFGLNNIEIDLKPIPTSAYPTP